MSASRSCGMIGEHLKTIHRNHSSGWGPLNLAIEKLWPRSFSTAFGVVCVLAVQSASVRAGDLAVSSVELQQGFQNSSGTTTLVAGRPTAVRVKIAVTGQTTAQANVDAVLRVKVNGAPMVGSPDRRVVRIFARRHSSRRVWGELRPWVGACARQRRIEFRRCSRSCGFRIL